MRLGRFLRIVALTAWLTGVTSYWWTFVPPTPSHVIPLEGRSHRWTPGLGNVIVLSHTGDGEARQSGPRGERRPPSFGPLQFYDPATGQLLREALTADDEILALTLAHREMAICHKDGVITAVDLRNPDKSVELEGVKPNSQFSFGPGTKVVVTHAGSSTAYNTETGEQLPDGPRYPALPRPLMTVFNGRERYATADGTNVYVFNAATGTEVCRIRLPTSGQYPALVQFSPDGKDLMVLEDSKSQTRTLTIWDSETGERTPKQLHPSLPKGPISRNGAWVITNDNATSLVALLVQKLPAKMTARLQRSKFFWNVMMQADTTKSHRIVLTDTSNGQPLGRYLIPSTADWLLVADDQRGAAAFGDHDEIRCYRVPANWNWPWLIKWSAGPVAIAWLLALLLRKGRLRQATKKARESNPPGLVTVDQPN
jgi:DNA-binding beta-propeller fold protein YncE